MVVLTAGFVLAFAAAAVATFLDCYFTMAKSLPRVPGLILAHPGILALSALCGACAVLAFALTNTRTRQRTTFLNANIGAAFAIPTYFTQLENTIATAMRVRSPELQQRAADEVNAVRANVPAPPMAQADTAWSNYYYSMTGICFDYCGPAVLKGFPGFRVT